MLHLGVYRDFRIKTEALRNAIHKQRVPIVLEYQNSSNAFEPIEDETASHVTKLVTRNMKKIAKEFVLPTKL